MTDVPPDLRLLAEEMFFVIPPPPNANREISERFVLHAPASRTLAFTGVGRVRLSDGEVDAAVAELRERFRALGASGVTWWVGPSATPHDLAARLRSHGFVPIEHASAEPRYEAMVMLEAPQPAPEGVAAHVVRDVDEYRIAMDVYSQVMGTSTEMTAERLARIAEWYELRHVSGESLAYLAWVDGEPAATASAAFTPAGGALAGGFTLEHLRGRGAYRALVRARWDDAAARGTPGLAVLGGSQSRPILERLGFQSLGLVEVLFDDFSRSRES